MAASTIRVLVVDDSALLRQILLRALRDDPHIEVVGTARNGIEALEKAVALQPDVITLDIEMPELDGIEVLRRLEGHAQSRVVVLSSITDPATTYLALSLGAVEFVVKPTAGVASSADELAHTLREKIRIAYNVPPGRAATVARMAARIASRSSAKKSASRPTLSSAPLNRPTSCVAFASSTGGPPALEVAIAPLTRALPAALVVVQHLPAGFSASLARRLSAAGEIQFREAERDMPLEAGCGYVAPPGAHLRVTTSASGVRRFELTSEPPIHRIRPAADPLFESVAEQFRSRSVGVVLTGMGKDGARGAAAIHAAGGTVIAQDEATSVVWGMPQAAAQLDAVDRMLPVDLIGETIAECVHDAVSGRAT
jgi:two-component system, chemotaxis family, protein-glutamate methylesterase/glutaminase